MPARRTSFPERRSVGERRPKDRTCRARQRDEYDSHASHATFGPRVPVHPAALRRVRGTAIRHDGIVDFVERDNRAAAPGRTSFRDSRGRLDGAHALGRSRARATARPDAHPRDAGGRRHDLRLPEAAADELLDAQHLHPARHRILRRERRASRSSSDVSARRRSRGLGLRRDTIRAGDEPRLVRGQRSRAGCEVGHRGLARSTSGARIRPRELRRRSDWALNSKEPSRDPRGGPRCDHCKRWMRSLMGRKRATTIVPTTPARNTIMIGSMIEVRPATALSTSSS